MVPLTNEARCHEIGRGADKGEAGRDHATERNCLPAGQKALQTRPEGGKGRALGSH